MLHVFKVRIQYANGSHTVYNVAALDDLTARTKAIAEDALAFKESEAKQPQVDFCETTFVCDIVDR